MKNERNDQKDSIGGNGKLSILFEGQGRDGVNGSSRFVQSHSPPFPNEYQNFEELDTDVEARAGTALRAGGGVKCASPLPADIAIDRVKRSRGLSARPVTT